jgi:hypothetical protein
MPLKEKQRIIVQDPRRFKVAICGRRFGKTTLAIWLMCREAAQPNREIFYIAPTYRAAKMICWKRLRNKLQDLRWVQKVNETELTITLKNNSVISLKGADGGAQNLRGIGLDAVILDEAALIDEEAWTEVLRPALADRQGWALFISTPAGMNWIKDLYDLADQLPEEWASFQYTSLEGGNIAEEEIEAARRILDERSFRQEFLGSFETYSGRVFYAFDRKNNVKEYSEPLPHELHWGVDFNVDNLVAAIAVKLPKGLHIIDEIHLYGSSTHEIVNEIQSRYPDKRLIAYPDPAGSARSTKSNQTDHTIIRSANIRVIAPHSHNSVKDGVNAVNSLLANSKGEHNLLISPNCRKVIESMEKFTYKEGTSQPDKTSGYDHMADALRYLVDSTFPIRMPVKDQPIRQWGHKLHVPNNNSRILQPSLARIA